MRGSIGSCMPECSFPGRYQQVGVVVAKTVINDRSQALSAKYCLLVFDTSLKPYVNDSLHHTSFSYSMEALVAR